MRETITWFIVGSIASLVYLGLSIGLYTWLKVPAFWANTLAIACSSVLSYLGHYHFTFRKSLIQSLHRKHIPKFSVQVAGGYIVSTLIVGIVTWLKLPGILSFILSWFILPVINYLIMRFWTFL